MKKYSNNTLIILISFLAGICLIGFGLFQLVRQKSVSQLSPVISPLPVSAADQYLTQSGKPIQFVLLSFDGSLSLDMWESTRSFARQLTKEGKPVNFTYFISGVYLLGPGHTRVYQPPGLAAGTSAIGFSQTTDDVIRRIQEINGAVAEGNEIGSHANGHFQGGLWNQAQWNQEFEQFNNLTFEWQKNNQIPDGPGIPQLSLQRTPLGTVQEVAQLSPDKLNHRIIGFRAPLLSKNQWLYNTLPEYGYLYDASGVTNDQTTWPTQNKQGTWLIPLANIKLIGLNRDVISMDYNFYTAQSQAKNTALKGTAIWQKYYQEMLDSYNTEFQKNYNTTRAPVVIGHHFSTWNDGAYWEAMQTFAKDVCGQPEVRCGTYRDLVLYLNWLKAHERNL